MSITQTPLAYQATVGIVVAFLLYLVLFLTGYIQFDVSSLHAQYIKTKIKSAIKNDFYNVNIEKIEILKDEGLINQISYLSFQDLLDFEKNDSLHEVKINKIDKILTISLN